VVDRPALCDFFTPALVDRGQVVAAVGTGGSSPVLARKLKAALESSIPEGSGELAALLQEFRGEVKVAFPDIGKRSAFMSNLIDGPVAKAAMEGDLDRARTLLKQALAGR
jgi:precorrin-2 dehydrogenase/sirohydrochlorin ferrochelatase